MSDLIHPSTGKPLNPAPARQLDDASILNAFRALQMKIDAIAQQDFQTGILIEYIIDTINNFTLSDGSRPLEIKQEEFASFYETRIVEVQKELEELKEQAAKGTNV